MGVFVAKKVKLGDGDGAECLKASLSLVYQFYVVFHG